MLLVGENYHWLFENYRYDVYLDTTIEETVQDAEKLGKLELRSGGVYNFLIQKPLSNTTNTSVSTVWPYLCCVSLCCICSIEILSPMVCYQCCLCACARTPFCFILVQFHVHSSSFICLFSGISNIMVLNALYVLDLIFCSFVLYSMYSSVRFVTHIGVLREGGKNDGAKVLEP